MAAPAFPPDWSSIEAARSAALAVTMDRIARAHPRYRQMLKEHGIAPADIRTTADLARIPVTSKAALLADPAAFQLDPAAMPEAPDEARTVWDTMYTTGSTSGTPTPFVSTTADFYDILILQRRMLEIRGVGPDDRIASLFPLTRHPHGAFIRPLHAAASMNIPIVPCLPGNPSPLFALGQDLDAVVDTLARTRPTILWGVPSYLRRVLAHAAERAVALPEVRWLFVTGEGLSEEGRRELDARLVAVRAAAARVSISYGMTEIQGGLIECAPGTGYHNPLPEALAFDVVDPLTHAPVADGTAGLITLSHLRRSGTVLLRYVVGDLSVRTRERCPHCGRTTERFIRQPERADDLVKIKGTLVNPARAIAAVEGVSAVRDFLFTVAKAAPGDALAMDVLRLAVVLEPGADRGVPAAIAQRVKDAVGVTPAVEAMSPDAFAAAVGTGWKAKRFVDARARS
ncbi:MAG: AMP-binding protein [Alphaproteobacteria bacterium]|nr:AMP-binding protein [Alphaproteobacteria bacterium]